MKLYIVMSKWLGGGNNLGVFTSLELAQKEAKTNGRYRRRWANILITLIIQHAESGGCRSKSLKQINWRTKKNETPR